jgi:large subunit ribosomal protein L35
LFEPSDYYQIQETKLPKIKTHKATAKRFKYSGRGKLLRTKSGKSHLRRKKSKRVKRLYDEMIRVDAPADVKRVRKLAPYLKK